MLEPTLCHPGDFLIAVDEQRYIAVLALHGEEWAQDELELACQLHVRLDRGLLVVF